MNFCFGAVSKNVVDSIIQFSIETPERAFYLIPSRRQVDYAGGYANGWTTKSFAEYVKSRNPNILLERDHGGPGQGEYMDDGYASLAEDCRYFDIIHIDPWKTHPKLEDGAKQTVEMIRFCHNISPTIQFEIATEEAIRAFTTEELDALIQIVKSELTETQFERISFLVIQCGTRLSNGQNLGSYDANKLSDMLALAEKYGFIAKEHNGDWTSTSTIHSKYQQGLRHINISPEMAELENTELLRQMQVGSEQYERMYELCAASQKWKKWVPPEFDWQTRKDDIIRITSHYICGAPEVAEIKRSLTDIDDKLRCIIRLKLFELYQLYTTRESCIFCEGPNMVELLDGRNVSSMSLSLCANPTPQYLMPYNVLQCLDCNTFQNKYLAKLSIVYGNNHVDVYGSVKSNKHIQFADFITENTNASGFVEVGGCTGALADLILEKRAATKYTIVEPSFQGASDKIQIVSDYFENVDIGKIQANSIIMSDVFEHFYNPLDILRKLRSHANIQYLYLNHPDFDYAVKNGIDMFLNFEHTFLIEHVFLFRQFERFGFSLTRCRNYENNSLFLEFKRQSGDPSLCLKLQNSVKMTEFTKAHIRKLQKSVENMNYLMADETKSFYIWPASIHSIQFFTYGLHYKRLTGVVDNSPNKIGKYLHTYGLKCESFNNLLRTCENANTVIFITNTGPYAKEIDFSNTKATIIYVDDFAMN